MTRRRRAPHRLALLTSLVALAALLAAAASSSPVAGGTLIVGIGQNPAHLNPGISTGSDVHAVADSMFNGLVALDDNAVPSPELAERWEVSSDARVYTFHLRRDVRWHDDVPLTSDDVRFSFERVLLEYHARTRGALAGALAGIDTPDDHTVVFRFHEPYAALLQQLNVTEAPILPRHVYEVDDLTNAAVNLRPVGSGPFRFVEYVIDDRVVLERNPDYFRADLPYLDRLVFRVIPDDNTRLLALERGEVDYVGGVPAGEIERVEALPELTLHSVDSGAGGGFCVMTMAFNLERGAFTDTRVRTAFAHAIDREQLLEQVLFGNGRVATGPIHSGLSAFYTDAVSTYAVDPERAEALLDAAGYPRDANGTRLSATFMHFPAFGRYGEVLRQNLARIGVTLELVPLDRAAFVARVFEQRDFDTAIVSYCNNADPSIGVARVYVSSNIGPIPFSNAAAYRSEDVDRAFASAATLADPAERALHYHEAQRILSAELPYLWLVETRFTAASRAAVQGIEAWKGSPAERAWLAR
jgi:peptide/nickel transport system substrate-binding protein